MWMPILITVLAAAGNNIGKVLQKQATRTLPRLVLQGPVLAQYLGSTTWLVGMGADLGGALLMIVAFANAPVRHHRHLPSGPCHRGTALASWHRGRAPHRETPRRCRWCSPSRRWAWSSCSSSRTFTSRWVRSALRGAAWHVQQRLAEEQAPHEACDTCAARPCQSPGAAQAARVGVGLRGVCGRAGPGRQRRARPPRPARPPAPAAHHRLLRGHGGAARCAHASWRGGQQRRLTSPYAAAVAAASAAPPRDPPVRACSARVLVEARRAQPTPPPAPPPPSPPPRPPGRWGRGRRRRLGVRRAAGGRAAGQPGGGGGRHAVRAGGRRLLWLLGRGVQDRCAPCGGGGRQPHQGRGAA